MIPSVFLTNAQTAEPLSDHRSMLVLLICAAWTCGGVAVVVVGPANGCGYGPLYVPDRFCRTTAQFQFCPPLLGSNRVCLESFVQFFFCPKALKIV